MYNDFFVPSQEFSYLHVYLLWKSRSFNEQIFRGIVYFIVSVKPNLIHSISVEIDYSNSISFIGIFDAIFKLAQDIDLIA